MRESAAEPAPREDSRSPWIRGLALTSVAAVAALVFTRTSWLDRGQDANHLAREDAALLVDAVESFSHRLTDSVIPSAGQLVKTNPLQDELGSVYADMRSAIDFLALNFLPSSTRTAAIDVPSTRRI